MFRVLQQSNNQSTYLDKLISLYFLLKKKNIYIYIVFSPLPFPPFRKCLNCTWNSKIKSDWMTSKPQGSACLCHIFHQTPHPHPKHWSQRFTLHALILLLFCFSWLVGWLVFYFVLETTCFVGLADLELTIESRLISTCLNL